MNQLRRAVLLMLAACTSTAAVALGWGVGAWTAPNVSIARSAGDEMPPQPYRFTIETTPAAPPIEETAMPKRRAKLVGSSPQATSAPESAQTVAVAAVAAPAVRTAATTATPTSAAQASGEPPSDVKPVKPDEPKPDKPSRKWSEDDDAEYQARCDALAADNPHLKIKVDKSLMPRVGDDLPEGANPPLWCTVEGDPGTVA